MGYQGRRRLRQVERDTGVLNGAEIIRETYRAENFAQPRMENPVALIEPQTDRCRLSRNRRVESDKP